jgi:hypothetical protein
MPQMLKITHAEITCQPQHIRGHPAVQRPAMTPHLPKNAWLAQRPQPMFLR